MAGDKPGERNGGRLRLLFDMFNEVWKDILMKFCFQCFGTIDEALRFKIEGAFTGRLRQLKGRMGQGGGLVWKVVDRCDWRGSRFQKNRNVYFLEEGPLVEHSSKPPKMTPHTCNIYVNHPNPC
jgi:hypothetical protein